MIKTKKLVVLAMVALTLVTPLFGLVPASLGRAYAAPSDTATIDVQAKSYIYVRAIALCLRDSALRDKSGLTSKVDVGHMQGYNWFADSFLANGGAVNNTYLGIHDMDDHNGVKACQDGDWLENGFQTWAGSDGSGFGSDALHNICYSGFKRDGANNGQTAADCINDAGHNGNDFMKDGSGQDAANQFIKNVNKQFYGTDSTALPKASPAVRYYIAEQSFKQLCKATEVNAQQATLVPAGHLYSMTDEDGQKKQYQADKSQNDTVTVGATDNLGKEDASCASLVKIANDNAAAYATSQANNPTPDGGVSGADGATTDVNPSCGDVGGFKGFILQDLNPLDWLSCALLSAMTGAARVLDNGITTMLCVNESDIFKGASSTCGDNTGGSSKSQNGYYAAWNSFRVLALGMIVIAGLVMIISQALGFEVFDAYTIKKTLPRILIAGVGITLSWQLLQFLVALSNGLGIGIRSLIYAPFAHAGFDSVVLGGGGQALTGLFAVGSLAVLGALGLLSFIGTALLAILIAFVVLVLRNILIILLIIMAPIAIAAYALPNTEKIYKSWIDWLVKALMVFPFITALIAVGHVFAAISSDKAKTEGGTLGLITSLVAFAAYIIPYFIIPFAFRLAGGALGTLGGIVNDRSKGGFDRLKKFRGNQTVKNLSAMRNGNRVQGTKYIPGSRHAASAFNRTTVGLGTGATGGFGFGQRGQEAIDQRRRTAAQDLFKDPRFNAIKDDDNALRALTYKDYDAAKQGLMRDFNISEPDATRAVSSARASGLGFGQPSALAAAQQLVNTGTGYDNVQQLTETLARASGGNASSAAGLAGFANSVTKSAGRHDLAPGFQNLNNAVQSQVQKNNGIAGAGPTAATYSDLAENAWGSASLYQHANDKPKNIEAAIKHHKNMLIDANASGDQSKMQQAAVFFSELKSMQPNASGDVAKRINEVLADGSGTTPNEGIASLLRDTVDNRLTLTPSSPTTNKQARDRTGAVISGRTRQETASERIERLSRGFERPDPNHM